MSILSIDFGGTRTRVGWFDADLHLLARDETLSLVQDPQAVVINRIIDLARRVVPPGEKPTAIGICGPGPEAYTGLIMNAATLPNWDRVPLAQIISEAFGGVPTHMENDGNLAALAEYHMGAGKGANPMLYLTVSTGIGGGVILDGRLFTGWRGLAFEPGHLKFPARDGKLYSLEALASGTAIGRLARERLAESAEPSILREFPAVDGRMVGEAAQGGDPLALDVIQEAGHWLGLGFLALVHLFNPQAIVLGGSVTKLGDLILNPARQTMRDLLITPLYDGPDLIRVAGLGEDVCLIGAAYHVRGLVQSNE
ncbi:MAG: ROK family protein [Anaerolineae bacterium]|nr:ROK family protein [Anaerolineae bacterium]